MSLKVISQTPELVGKLVFVNDHLQQRENYYAFRKRLIRINRAVYYLLPDGAFGLCFVEILGLMLIVTRVVTLSVYIA
jgi:hypothetical protein